MTTDPIRQIAHPSLPSVPKFSPRKYDPSTALYAPCQRACPYAYMCFRLLTDPMSTLRAPSGVTRIGGANAYAAKLATSPITTVWREYVVRGVEDG